MKPINPQIAEYLKAKMAGQDEYQQAAEQNRELQSGLAGAQLASSIGDALAGRNNSGTQAAFQNMRNQAQDSTIGDFSRQRQFAAQDLAAKRDSDENDPNSQKSVNFRNQVESMMPLIAKAYGPKWATVAAADGPNLFNLQKMQDAQNETKMRYQGQRQEKQELLAQKNSPEGRLKALSGTDKARYDNALMALKGIDDMAAALDNGQNTFSVVGDNDYTAASRRATEAYGRMQSGGAINKEEESRFEKTLPGLTDSKEIQRKKLMAQKAEMISRLKTLGFTPEQAGYEPKDFKYGSEARKQPKTITQNGHTYTFNEATGQYE